MRRGLMSRPGSPERNILRASGRAAASSAAWPPEFRSARSEKKACPVSRSSRDDTGSEPLAVDGMGHMTSPLPWSRRNAPISCAAFVASDI
jgi:hypothetical protein